MADWSKHRFSLSATASGLNDNPAISPSSAVHGGQCVRLFGRYLRKASAEEYAGGDMREQGLTALEPCRGGVALSRPKGFPYRGSQTPQGYWPGHLRVQIDVGIPCVHWDTSHAALSRYVSTFYCMRYKPPDDIVVIKYFGAPLFWHQSLLDFE